MILYFTGTGNSRWVAERLAEATHDTTLNTADYLKNDSVPEELANADRVGVVFPVHAWYAPRVVVHFLLRLRLPHCKYRYAVCTCGDDMGKGMNRLAKRFPLDAAWSVAMPNTYIPMFDLDDDALCHQHEGGAPWLKTYVLNPLFVRFIITSKGFHVDEGCISCAKCSKACPVENIQMVDGHPVWGKHCIHCMACLHTCPQKVIQYKKTSQKKGRYHLADYL